MMSLQSALLGYGIFAGLMRLPLPSAIRPTRAFTPQENVVLQTTAVATGTLPLAAGLVGIIPAMEMLDFERDGEHPIFLGWGSLMAWSAAVAFFGYDSVEVLKSSSSLSLADDTSRIYSVFLAAPLRRQVVGLPCWLESRRTPARPLTLIPPRPTDRQGEARLPVRNGNRAAHCGPPL